METTEGIGDGDNNESPECSPQHSILGFNSGHYDGPNLLKEESTTHNYENLFPSSEYHKPKKIKKERPTTYHPYEWPAGFGGSQHLSADKTFKRPPLTSENNGLLGYPRNHMEVDNKMSAPCEPKHTTPQSSPSNLSVKQKRKAGIAQSCAALQVEETSSKSAISKLKPSNVPFTKLRIGNWERQAACAGDLVCKFYYAKKQLVWELQECDLKSKIEVAFADITAMNIDNVTDPQQLEVELAKPPRFYEETNRQPKKNTMWIGRTDFTGGAAVTCKVHTLTFDQGVLGKHLEKLMQCDPRLGQLIAQGGVGKYGVTFPQAVKYHANFQLSGNLQGKPASPTIKTIQPSIPLPK